jgi:CHAD domain-containing protein
MVTEIRETERKYELQPGAQLPTLGDLPMVATETDSGEQTLEAEYYDTADLRLIRAGVTLRRRRGGTDAGWHLKLPAGGDSRDEIRLPLGRAGRKVPAELAALVRVHTRGEALRPVARISTRRHLRLLLDHDGTSLAEVAADDVSAQAMGDETTLSRWQEVEVELTGGSVQLLDAAEKVLRRSGLRPARQRAKLERALAGRLPPAGPLAPGRPERLTRRSSAAEIVLGYAAAQVAALKAADPQVRRDAPDSVHQMRVGTRRLRSTLKSFRDVLFADDTSGIGAELTWLGGVLGAPRDAEVLAGRVAASVEQLPPELVLGPVQARLRAHFAPVEAATRAAALKALDGDRYLALLDRLDLLLADPPLTARAGSPASEVLPAAVDRMRRRVRKRMRRAQGIPAGPDRDAALHEARKAAKDARYSAEAASLGFGKPARQFALRMKKVQSVLGDHHDAVVARGTVREIGVQAHLAGENAFSYGVLYERDSHLAMDLDRQARQAWKRASRRKYRRWLD